MGKSVSSGGRGPGPSPGRDPRLEGALSRVRRRIDRLDGRISSLLERRRGEVVEAGRIKSLLGLPVEDPDREERIVTRIRGRVRGAEGKEYLEEVYRTIFRCSRVLEGGG